MDRLLDVSAPRERPVLAGPAAEPAPAPLTGTAGHALLMVITTVVVALFNYALNILLGWNLSPEAYGRVGVTQTIIFIGVWFLGAGFPWVVSRAVAQTHGAGPIDTPSGAAAWRTYKTALLANGLLTVGLVALLGLAFARGWLPLEPAYAPLIAIAAVTIAALGMGAVPDAGLQGLFRFRRIATVRISEASINLALSVVLVVLGWGAVGALGGFALAAVVAAGLNIWFMRDQPFWRAPGWGGLATVQAALPMTLAVFGGVLLTNIDLLAVKFLSQGLDSDSLSGAYQVAAVLARVPFFVGSALVSAFYPRIAQAAAVGQEARAGRELLRWIGLGVLPLNVILLMAAPAVVLFFFPARYAGAAGILALLAAGSGFLVLAGGLAAILQAGHRARVPALVMLLAVGGQVVGLVFLVPAWGLAGAALTSLAAGGLACMLLIWQCRRLRFAPPRLGRQVVALLVLGLTVAPLGAGIVTDRLWVALWVAAAGAAYFLVCALFHLLDRAELLAVLPSFDHRRGGIAVSRLLDIVSMLNRWGARWGRFT